MAPMHAGLGSPESGIIGHTRGQARHPSLGFLSGRLSRTVLAEFGGSTRLAGFVLGLRRWAGAVRHRCQVAVHGLQLQRMASSVPALRAMPSPLKHAPGANHVAAWRTIRPCSPALAKYRYLWPFSNRPGPILIARTATPGRCRGGGAGHLPPKCLHVPGLLRAQVPRPATATPSAKPDLCILEPGLF